MNCEEVVCFRSEIKKVKVEYYYMASFSKKRRVSKQLTENDIQGFLDNLDNDDGELTDSDIDFGSR